MGGGIGLAGCVYNGGTAGTVGENFGELGGTMGGTTGGFADFDSITIGCPQFGQLDAPNSMLN